MILDDAPDSWHLKRLDEYTIIKPFDCGDEVLNNYLLQESKFYLSERLAVTYIIESEEETIAYFCLLNDKVSRNIDAKTWNKINKKIPNAKRKGTYPAVKIGRLAVTKKYAKSGFGEFMLDSVKQMCSLSKLKTSLLYCNRDVFLCHFGCVFFGVEDRNILLMKSAVVKFNFQLC